jgi:hypothetical protein
MDSLKAILADESFLAHDCLEDVSWIRSRKQHISFAATCFCDIPLSKISRHIEFYGSYGLGLTKSWGTANGLNPVLYLNTKSPLKFCLRTLFEHADREYEAVGSDAYLKAIELAAYVKPYEGVLKKDGVEIQKRFYDESEWRYVPHGNYGNTDHLDQSIEHPTTSAMDKSGSKKFRHRLKFSQADVKYIFVPTSNDVGEMLSHLQTIHSGLPQSDLALLATKIVTLDEIRQDI